MAETAVEIAVCSACGADVRDESVFCYNCGKRVAGEVSDSKSAEADSLSADLLEKAAPVVHRSNEPRPPLRSAASLRKQRRASNRQPIEVSWEPATRSPASFMIATIVLVTFALVLLVLALYLR